MSIPLPRPLLRRRELRHATLQLRFAATLIDLGSVLAVVALTLGAGVTGYRRVRKRRDERGGPLRAIADEPNYESHDEPNDKSHDEPHNEPTRARRWPDGQRFAEALGSRWVKLGLELLAIALPLRRGEKRSLGFRMLGLRLADVRGGGEPTPGQRLARALTRRLWRTLHRRLLPVRTPPVSADREKMQTEIAAARRAHANDQDAMQRAVMHIYRENTVDPVRVSCLPLLARVPLTAAIDLPMPWSSRAQSLVDWLSGTVVVVDRQRPSRRAPRRLRSIKMRIERL